MDNQLSFWYTGQLVTAAQMNDFSRDIYRRFDEVTSQETPCILNLDLSLLNISGSNVNVPAGSFRFAFAHYAFLPYDTAIYGTAPAASVPFSGNGYVVARYVITPTTPNQTNYTFPTSYLFVATINPTTDVIVCTITSGVISSTGKFFNYLPDIIDTGGLVSITGANGLSVTNHIACNTLNSGSDVGVGGNLTTNSLLATSNANVNGMLTVTGNSVVKAQGFFTQDTLGPFTSIVRDTTTLPNTYQFRIISEASTGSLIPGATHGAAIQLSGGSGSPTLLADYSSGNGRFYNTATPGNTTDSNALAMMGDIAINGFGITSVVNNANGWSVQYKNGLIEQWGTATISGGSGTVTANLVVPVTNIPSNVPHANAAALTGGNTLTPLGNVFLASASTIQITFTTNFTNAQPVFWSVRGY